MVVFTCSHCGESVKKNQVEKHYLITRCRNSFPSLTCVDCLKDFNGDEYNSHTSCVTEEERYSAKGFVSKPPTNKGKRKQENWVHFIRKILDGNLNVNRRVKFLLERVGSDPGLPQKRAKFLNFCKSKFSHVNPDVFDEAWEFLQKKREEFQKEISVQANNQTNGESGQADRKRKRIDSNNECSAEFSENGVSDVSKQTSEHAGEKKQKQDKPCNFTDSQNDNEEDEENVEAESKKKKKKKKSSFQNSGVSENVQEYCDDSTVVDKVISEGANENEMHILLSKKEKKEKRKKEKYEKQLLEIQGEPVNGDEEQENNNTEETRNRKKKKKKCRENGVAKDLNTVVKTSKQKQQSDIETINNREDVEQEISDEKPTKFSWEQTVIKLLESKGELPLKRVEKKVVNEYVNSGVHVDSVEKVIAKFNKKILKMSRVKVKKDIVKLVS